MEYLHRDKTIEIIVASPIKEEVELLASKYTGVQPMSLNVLENPETLRELVNSVDVVVSLVPHVLHHVIAKSCIQAETHLVTTSYLNPEMKALHEE